MNKFLLLVVVAASFFVDDAWSQCGKATKNLKENRVINSIVTRITTKHLSKLATAIFKIAPPTPYFKISPHGYLRVAKHLDREAIASFSFNIHVFSLTGAPMGCLTLNINIIDTNDHAPLFSKDLYIFSVPRNLPKGGTVGQVKAVDEDLAYNGQVRYSTRNPSFAVHPVTGVITLKVSAASLKKRKSNWLMSVSASDGGAPSFTSRVPVYINIE